MKNVKNIIILVAVLVVAGNFKLLAAPLVPDLYISGGLSTGNSEVVGNSGSLSYKGSDTAQGYGFALGVRPFDVPLFGGLRAELQYAGDLSGDIKSSRYGAALYYDVIRVIPVITPYIGVGVYGSKPDVDRNISGINDQTALVGLNFGVDASLPLLGFSFFAEYRMLDESFGNFFKGSSDKVSGEGNNFSKSEFMVGIKYYLIK